MKSEFFYENGLINVDDIIPTKEEMEKTIKHITESCEISLCDEIVLWKMKLIKLIVNSKKGNGNK